MGTKVHNPDPTRRSSRGADRAATSGSFGLGDAVAVVAKRIAPLVGVDPQNCLPCQQRRARLNDAGARAGARIRNLFRRG